MEAYLEIWKSDGPELVPLEGDRLTIGKAGSNDLTIEGDGTLSRLHAVLERFPAGWILRDASSRNGTFVNGERVFTDRVLRHGDEIRVGRTRLVFRGARPTEETDTDLAEPPPELTDLEAAVLLALCRPLLTGDVFTEPASDREISEGSGVSLSDLPRVIAELGTKFDLEGEGDSLKARIANESLRRGAVTLAQVRGEISGGSPRARPADRAWRFEREGEYWSIEYGEDAFRLRDSKGLGYLAKLLSEPGREFHAMDLAMERAPASTAVRREPDLVAGGPSDAGAVLDTQAKEEYRRRIQDLEEEAEDADAMGDAERATRAREERDFIVHQLAGALGLGGRDRKAASETERFRLSVTKAIRSAIERIAKHSDGLGQHLDRAVRTGTFCMYAPTESASWKTVG